MEGSFSHTLNFDSHDHPQPNIFDYLEPEILKLVGKEQNP
jgi:hypothetical protein